MNITRIYAPPVRISFVRMVPLLSVFLFILVTCGCVADNPAAADKDPAGPAGSINASRDYYDRMVEADPGNATAWCVRGM